MEKILIIDTETTNDIDCPIMYDFSCIVADLHGNVYDEFAYVVADIFLNEELMSSAYYIDKIPSYWEDIKSGKRELKTLRNIRKVINEVMREYNITKVFAYNCRFDYLSTVLTQRYITKSKYRWFFPYGTEFFDILKAARTYLNESKNYAEFCETNGYLTKTGRKQFTAEVVYRYLNDETFIEEHKGLEDCKIEYEILLECLNDYDYHNSRLFAKDKRITEKNLSKMPQS